MRERERQRETERERDRERDRDRERETVGGMKCQDGTVGIGYGGSGKGLRKYYKC